MKKIKCEISGRRKRKSRIFLKGTRHKKQERYYRGGINSMKNNINSKSYTTYIWINIQKILISQRKTPMHFVKYNRFYAFEKLATTEMQVGHETSEWKEHKKKERMECEFFFPFYAFICCWFSFFVRFIMLLLLLLLFSDELSGAQHIHTYILLIFFFFVLYENFGNSIT